MVLERGNLNRAGAQIKSRELRSRTRAMLPVSGGDKGGGGGGGGGGGVGGSYSGPGGSQITLCPADDWHKGYNGRRLGPLQVYGSAGRILDAGVPYLFYLVYYRLACFFTQ